MNIIANCTTFEWKNVLNNSALESLAQIDIGLRSRILGLRKELINENYAEEIRKIENNLKIVRPSEGDIPELLENDLFESIKSLGYDWLWVGNEFGTERKLHWIDDLIKGDEIPPHGSVFTHDYSLLVTVHWDSHFVLICSSKQKIDSIVALKKFEGFFCDPETRIYWSLQKNIQQQHAQGRS